MVPINSILNYSDKSMIEAMDVNEDVVFSEKTEEVLTQDEPQEPQFLTEESQEKSIIKEPQEEPKQE